MFIKLYVSKFSVLQLYIYCLRQISGRQVFYFHSLVWVLQGLNCKYYRVGSVSNDPMQVVCSAPFQICVILIVSLTDM